MPQTAYEQFILYALLDNFALVAQRFDPPEGVSIRACAVISCATGIHARFYRDFATYVTPFLPLSCTSHVEHKGGLRTKALVASRMIIAILGNRGHHI